MPKISRHEAYKAFHVLEQFGRQQFCESTRNDQTEGQCIGIGISAFTGDVVAVAKTVLQDWNYHMEMAVITAIQSGDCTREGRIVTLTLPEHWDKM